MKQIIIVIFIFLGSFSVKAQSNFPVSWLGSYEGNLIMEFPDGVKDTASMTFDLLPTLTSNRWTYRASYFSKKWGDIVKDYEIFWNDTLKNPNHFVIDERDGILIDLVFMNGRFFSTFGVESDIFNMLLEETSSGLFMEIRCTNTRLGISSTSIPDPQGYSAAVKSSYTYNVQYANLKRKK